MSGIAGIAGMAGGGNPLSGMAGSLGGAHGGVSMSGVGGLMGGGQGGGQGGGLSGIQPTQAASPSQGASFGSTLKDMVITKPSESKAKSSDLALRFAAGENIDPHQLSIASAKAGVEIQMATRTISSAVSAVRTLFQMQI